MSTSAIFWSRSAFQSSLAGINPALLPGSAAAFNQMGQLQQQMRFGGSDHSMGGQLQVQPSLPVGTGSPTAAPSGQMMRSASEQLPASAGGGFHWPKSGEGWQQRPTVCGGSGGGNGGSAFVRPPFSPPPTRSGGASLKASLTYAWAWLNCGQLRVLSMDYE